MIQSASFLPENKVVIADTERGLPRFFYFFRKLAGTSCNFQETPCGSEKLQVQKLIPSTIIEVS